MHSIISVIGFNLDTMTDANDLFLKACENGGSDEIKELLQQSLESSSIIRGLALCNSTGNRQVMELLLSIYDPYTAVGKVPIVYEYISSDVELARVFLKNASDSRYLEGEYQGLLDRLLRACCVDGHLELTTLVLQELKLFGLTRGWFYHWNPVESFRISCDNGDIDMVAVILGNSDLSMREYVFKTVCRAGDLVIVTMMIEERREAINSLIPNMFRDACGRGDTDMAELLIENYSHTESHTYIEGFYWACAGDHMETVKVLCEKDTFDLDFRDKCDYPFGSGVIPSMSRLLIAYLDQRFGTTLGTKQGTVV